MTGFYKSDRLERVEIFHCYIYYEDWQGIVVTHHRNSVSYSPCKKIAVGPRESLVLPLEFT